MLIVQRRLTHYRVPFFERLRGEMKRRGVELVLAHGDPTTTEASKRDEGELPWAYRLGTRYLLGGRVCWQPFSSLAQNSDLVILTHENKLLCNLWAQYRLAGPRVALWGHGANLQGSSTSWRERFKRRTALQADWWFGYTELSRALILGNGFPAGRITVVDNAIDTLTLRKQCEAVLPEQLSAWRRQLGSAGNRIGVFLGSLYGEKRIDFLLDAASKIRARVPDFELVIVGTGPESGKVEAFCATNAWARYLGPLIGEQKAQVLALAHVMLNPGLVGLGILDSFVCQVPLVTTDCGLHSPEIAYLENGRNGAMTRDVMAEYVDVVVSLLVDGEYRAQLVAGCAASASRYTIDNMAHRFADGIMECLARPVHRSVS
ncbi:glycosyltransferase family 4 protein [Aerolutibacter daejeonensis]|uniref:glycosyltransferase family 4 protein n=1 Tax=Aerolutibacter daejeonensis TaxID=346181 RepID=UPI0018DB7C7C|nr:glycosyltransferase family 4 protein [Lysobacter daejeonensis]